MGEILQYYKEINLINWKFYLSFILYIYSTTYIQNVDHHHEEYDIPEELIPKLKEYWMEPNIFSFNTKIKEIDEEWISLKKNYFYPEGGGQLPDLGVLIPKSDQSKQYKIADVQIREKETWLKIPKHDLIEGSQISAVIDKERRFSLSRNHSAQHLVSAIFWEELGFDTTRAEIREYESQVEFDTSPTLDQIDEVNNKITNLINDNLAIQSRYYQNLEKADLKYRGQLEELDVYRLVAIGEYDLNPCGGTHVRNTKEIESIFINKIESKKVRFISGKDAQSLYSKNAVNLIKLSRLTSVSFDKIPETVENLMGKKYQIEKRVNKLEALIIELQDKLNQFEVQGDHKLKIYDVPRINKGVIAKLNENMKPNEIVFIIDEETSFILSSGDEKLTANLMHLLRKSGVRGGGKGKSVMGKLNTFEISEVKRILVEFLEN